MKPATTHASRDPAVSPRGWMQPGLRLVATVGLLVTVGLPVTGVEAHAQDGARTWGRVDVDERGWIGVSFDISADGSGLLESIRIVEVSDGSPASDAGLRAGDRVVAVNDLRTPRELASLPELLRLRVGDPVVMIVERDGDRRRVRMRAAPRPRGFATGRRVEVSVRTDSLVESWSRSMDSLGIYLRTGEGGGAVRIRGGRGPVGPQRLVVAGDSDHRVQVPFEFFVFQGEAHDSLRHEMVEVNAMVMDLEARIRAREQELRQSLRRRPGSVADDPQLQRLQDQLGRVSTRSQELESAMAEAARATAGLEYDPVVSEDRGSARDERAASSGEFRPLTPYLLGRNLVAGAEVVDLEPELARYFDVSRGVLVTKVTPGTPADIAGIVPGDVITRMDQVGVRSVEDLRYGVSVAGDTLPLTLIRQGESRQILLRKR